MPSEKGSQVSSGIQLPSRWPYTCAYTDSTKWSLYYLLSGVFIIYFLKEYLKFVWNWMDMGNKGWIKVEGMGDGLEHNTLYLRIQLNASIAPNSKFQIPKASQSYLPTKS